MSSTISAPSLPLEGRVALVTGSSKGIGASIVKRLAADGASVVINYARSAQAAEELASSINAGGVGKAIAVQADVSSITEAKRLLETTVSHFGKIDILVLNAGLMDYGTLAQITETSFDDHFNINVKVPLFLAQAAAPLMQAGGRIIFFSTSLTMNSAVPPNYLIYVATKGSVEQIVRVLAKDLGAKGINVNAVAPGPTDTDLFRNGKTEAQFKFFESLHPQKRIGQPDEIAPVVAFLSKEESSWVNGQTIFVNGGFNFNNGLPHPMASTHLNGKVALITGASRGIGAAIATRLASDGAKVVINYNQSSVAAEKLVSSINTTHGQGRAIAFKANMSSISETTQLVDKTIEAFGQLDILVLNAAVMDDAPLASITPEQYDKHFDLNVKSPLFMTQAAAKFMKPGGRVIFIGTDFTKNSSLPFNYLLYVATKGSIEQIVRVLAKDLGAKGITVNAVSPGPVDTDLFNDGKTEEQIKFYASLHPQKRIAQPKEISSVISFLSGEESSWINGQMIFANGGFNV
ncbi:short-chain dehydrogenases/reductases (SDR) family protein [Abortiporus biennis]